MTTMKLDDIPQAWALKKQLALADDVLQGFERSAGPTCPVKVFADDVERYEVLLPAVPREVALGAARSARDLIVAKLQNLGVEVN